MNLGAALLALNLFLLMGCLHSGGSERDPCVPAQVKAEVLATARHHYLWPELLKQDLDPDAFGSPEALLAALITPAREAGRDRDWTSFVDSAAQREHEAGRMLAYGFRLGFRGSGLFIAQVTPGSGAAAAGLARGQEVLAAAATAEGLDAPGSQIGAGSPELAALLYPEREGAVLHVRVRPRTGPPVDAAVAARALLIDPVPGAEAPRILDAGHGHRVGYLPLATFGGNAAARLRTVMGRFRQAGATDLIVDLRYNPGGDTKVAILLANLLRRTHGPDEVLYKVQHNPRNRARDHVARFSAEPDAMDPGKLAFIVSGSSASASEAVPNVLAPYYGHRLALVGSRTAGKPVGQSLHKHPGCGWALWVVSFQFQNAQGGGGYFGGLPYPGFAGVTCRAEDDLTRELGDPAEASLAAALAWIATGANPGPFDPPSNPWLASGPRLDLGPERTERLIPGLF